jgi:hypothetical protein
MSRYFKGRFWIEVTGAGVGAALLGATIVSPSWIETVFGADPDSGSGLLEWLIVVSSLILLACAAALARREWRGGSESGTQTVKGAGPSSGGV